MREISREISNLESMKQLFTLVLSFSFFKYYRRHFETARAAQCNWHKNNHHNKKKKGAEGRNSTTISLHLYLVRRKKKKERAFSFFSLYEKKKGKTAMRQISTHLCLATYKRTHRRRCKSKKKKKLRARFQGHLREE